MIAWIRATFLIFTQAFGSLLLSKKTLFFGAMNLGYGVLIALLFFFAGDRARQDSLFAFPSLFVFVQILVPLTAVYYSISAVREEIAEKTLTFLLTAPIRRSSIWIGKWAAATAVSTLVIGLGYLCAVSSALFLPVAAREGRALHGSTSMAFAWAVVAGPVAYAAMGTFLAVRFRRAMLAGAIFVFSWEGFAGSTPANSGVRDLTVVDSVRTLILRDADSARRFRREMVSWASAGEFRPWRGDSLEEALEEFIPSKEEAWKTLAWFTGICLLLALLSGAGRDYETAPKE